MAVKEDIRITKTKEALSKAFFEMLVEMPLEDITVNDLCTRADVRRATFYKHFRDKSDFVFYLIKAARERFDAKTTSGVPMSIKDYCVTCARSVVAYLLKYEQTIKGVIKSDARHTFIEIFVRQNYEDTIKRFEDSRAAGHFYFTSSDVMASMIIGGVAHCIVRWYDQENRCSTDKLIADIGLFVDRVIS